MILSLLYKNSYSQTLNLFFLEREDVQEMEMIFLQVFFLISICN